MSDHKLKHLEEQLKKIGANYRFWGRAELRELANVLLPNEEVMHCVNGSYEGGFAMLAATNQRVLLVDKKPFYLTLEDVRFDMISEIDYNHRLLNSTVLIQTPNKSMRFVAYNQHRLRQLFHFVQTQVMEIRQHYQQQGQIWKEYATSLQNQNEQAAANQQQQLAYNQPMVQQFSQPAATPFSGQPELSPGPGAAAASQPIAQQPIPPMPAHPMAFRTVAPIVSAYTRLPMMSRQRRFLGSRAVNAPMPPRYPSSFPTLQQ